MEEDAEVVLAINLPVQLGCVQQVVAGTGNGAKVGQQVGQLRGIRTRACGVGGIAKARGQFA